MLLLQLVLVFYITFAVLVVFKILNYMTDMNSYSFILIHFVALFLLLKPHPIACFHKVYISFAIDIFVFQAIILILYFQSKADKDLVMILLSFIVQTAKPFPILFVLLIVFATNYIYLYHWSIGYYLELDHYIMAHQFNYNLLLLLLSLINILELLHHH